MSRDARAGSYTENEAFKAYWGSFKKNTQHLKMYSKENGSSSANGAQQQLDGSGKSSGVGYQMRRYGTYAHSMQAATLLARRNRGLALTQRQRVFLFLEEPSAGRLSSWFSLFMTVTLLTAAVSSTLETLVFWQEWVGPNCFIVAEILFNSIFTCEALLRVATYTPFRHVWRMPMLWLDVLTILPFWLRLWVVPASFAPDAYLSRHSHPNDDVSFMIRVVGTLASWRLLKLARYYEGAGLLARAVAQSLRQLLVPMFMLLVMLVCFSGLLIELEWDSDVETCNALWQQAGVTPGFLRKHMARGGIRWDCSVCSSSNASAIEDSELAQLCLMCPGHPPGHPECMSMRWEQRYPDIPTAMIFMVSLVTPAVTLDPAALPTTWRGVQHLFQLLPTLTLHCTSSRLVCAASCGSCESPPQHPV